MAQRRHSPATALALTSALTSLACGFNPSPSDDDTGEGTGSSSSGGDDGPVSVTQNDDGPESTGDPTNATVDTGPATDSSESGVEGSSSSGVVDSSSGEPACEGMTFFATSAGSGDAGGNLGGLAGADAMCQAFADAVGQGGCTWHAYLSATEENARDRIGPGPWFNFNGDMIASDVESLHADGLSNGDPQHVFDENGIEVPGPQHDILTGSQEDGTLLDGTTCADWTSDTGDEIARVGHSDIPDPQFSPSWNSAHDTPGCSAADLVDTGGAGRLYCFAID